MALRNIRTQGDPILTKECRKIEKMTPKIQELIQGQLNSGGSWNVKSMAAEGTGDSQYCYSMPGTALYVMHPDQASVDAIKSEMQAVENGEILTTE